MKKLLILLLFPLMMFAQDSTLIGDLDCGVQGNSSAFDNIASEVNSSNDPTYVEAYVTFVGDAWLTLFSENSHLGVFYQSDDEGLVVVGSIYETEDFGSSEIPVQLYGSSDSNGLVGGESLIYILESGCVLYNLNIIAYDLDSDNPLVFGDGNESFITDIEITPFSYCIAQAIINEGNTAIQTCLDSKDLYVQTADSYLWSTGETTQTIEVTETDTYSVTITNQIGCESSAEVFVEFIGPCGGTGCTDTTAFNYNSEATLDDGSCCLISGCSDPTNIFYNPEACYFDSNLCVTIEDCSDIIIPFPIINDVSCYNESDGSIEVIFNSIFGGTEPYNVFWEGLSDSNGDGIDDTETVIFDPNNDGLLENLEAGNYKITIIDNLGCTGTTIDVSISDPAGIDSLQNEINILQNIIDTSVYGDVNCDGEVNSQDAALILQFITGLIEDLPYGDLCE